MSPSVVTKLRSAAASFAAVTIVAVLAIGLWHWGAWYWELPKALLPTPRQCLSAAMKHDEALIAGAFSTGKAAVIGLVSATVIGSLISIIFSQSKLLRAALFPYVILLQTVPVVAVAPLLIIWSGYTFRTVVIVTVIICLFPIVNSVTAGLTRIDRDMADLFNLYNVGRIKRLQKLQIPSAVSDLMIGVKTSSGLAVIGAIVAEFFVGNGSSADGLGILMTGWQALAKTDALMAAVFVSAVLGLILFAVVHFVSTILLSRWTSATNERRRLTTH